MPDPATVVQHAADEHYMAACREVSGYMDRHPNAEPAEVNARISAEKRDSNAWATLTEQQQQSVLLGVEAGAWSFCLPA